MTVRAAVLCRDHQAYVLNDALIARGRLVAAVFARASIGANVRVVAAAVSGPEHYHLGAAPWLVDASLTFADLPWWGAACERGAPRAAREDAAYRVARLCWGAAAAAGRLRTPVGALTLIDSVACVRLELRYALSAAQIADIVGDALDRAS